MAEAEDLKSSQCGFDPHSGHLSSASIGWFVTVINTLINPPRVKYPALKSLARAYR